MDRTCQLSLTDTASFKPMTSATLHHAAPGNVIKYKGDMDKYLRECFKER
jgi:hypothetical protein